MRKSDFITNEVFAERLLKSNNLEYKNTILYEGKIVFSKVSSIEFKDNEVIYVWEAVLSNLSNVKFRGTTKLPVKTQLPVLCYSKTPFSDKIENLKNNDIIQVEGELREICFPKRYISNIQKGKLAQLLFLDFEDGLLDDVANILNYQYIGSYKKYIFSEALTSNKNESMDLSEIHSEVKLIAIKDSISYIKTDITDIPETYTNEVLLEGSIFRYLNYQEIPSGYKFFFEVKVNRPDSNEKYDLIRCSYKIGREKGQKFFDKFSKGLPIRIAGRLEQNSFNNKNLEYKEENERMKELAALLEIDFLNPIILTAFKNLLDFWENGSLTNEEIVTIHSLYGKNKNFNENAIRSVHKIIDSNDDQITKLSKISNLFKISLYSDILAGIKSIFKINYPVITHEVIVSDVEIYDYE